MRRTAQPPAVPERDVSRRLPALDTLMAVGQEACGTSFSLAVVATVQGAAPQIGELRDRVEQYWAPPPRLRLRRHADENAPGTGRWTEAAHLDPAEHVSVVPARPGVTTAEVTGTLVTERMPRVPGGALWHLHLLPDTAPERFTLVLRAHHALLDMASLGTMMRALCDGPGALPALPPYPEATSPAFRPRRGVPPVVHALCGMTRRSAGPTDAPPDRGNRHIAWATVQDEVVQAAREAAPLLRATVNDVVLAAFAGALGVLPAGLSPAASGGRRYVSVPVNLRSPSEAERLGNGASAVRIPLPPAAADPVTRLRAVHRAMARNKALHRAEGAARLSAAAVQLPAPALASFSRSYFGRRRLYSLVCSNARLCADRLTFGGSPVISLFGVPPLLPGAGMQAMFTTFRETHTVCLSGDDARQPLLQSTADRFVEEVRALATLARRGVRRHHSTAHT
ncbi:WS/DGAT domain-containing protein [Streptomyces sp. DSM 42041]|uniref:diacylglycerol O-acyltransferase n=1 Tax=Streptomyces hazeniae TaxID=3075538 RepID=A0ABU2NWG9_9ACTN|nr:WS/DGAT domain-containing protein [Streptomyces sp. DSM 42041]MDT0380558.1 WS/DGAT domain-containing protein [Streptomyces sp. DSM 42041]